MSTLPLSRIGLALGLSLALTPAQATDSIFSFDADSVTLSAMPAIVTYPGGHQRGFATILPWFVFHKSNENPPFVSPDNAFLDLGLPLTEQISVGPIFDLRSGRSPNDMDANRFGSSRLTPETGLFAEIWVTKELRLRGEWHKGVSSSDNGSSFSLFTDYVVTIDKRQWSFGPRLTAGNSPYISTQYGQISNKLSGGLESVGFATSLTQPITPKISVTTFLRADRFIGAAANSPSVRDTNTRNVLTTGLGLNYTFKFK